jgi:hypothetical protein
VVQVKVQDPEGQATSHRALVQVTVPLAPIVRTHHALSQVMTLLGPISQVQTLCAEQVPLQESLQDPVQVLTSVQLSAPPCPASQVQVAPWLQVQVGPEQPQTWPGQGDMIVVLPQPTPVRTAASSSARIPSPWPGPGRIDPSLGLGGKPNL